MTLFSRAAMAAIATVTVGIVAYAPSAAAESFTLRIGAGQPMKPLEPIFMANEYFVPTVTERVANETEHKVRFIEAYGGTVAGPFDVLEAVEKGLFDIGLWCACFEPTKAEHFAFHYNLPFVTDDPVLQHKITRQVMKEFPAWEAALEQYNQKWLGFGSFSSYGLGTNFPWTEMSELAGHKIAAAGPNLPWVKSAGPIAVQTSLNEAYNSLQTGVYEGLVIFPTAWVGFKLYEPANYYKIVGWGSTTVYQMSVNLDTWDELPEDVRNIILEEAEIWMEKTAEESTKRWSASLKKLEEVGSEVSELPAEERGKMAEALGDWPKEKAQHYESLGLPGTEFFKRYLEIAQESGVELPHQYQLD